VRIRLLGGVSAISDRGEPVDVGPAKCQALLAALALSPGEAVPVWRLVEMVWGQAPPRTADRTLQSYVTRLRKSLGGQEAIARVGLAYRLDVQADAVDAARFEGLLDAGEVEAALAEWTGTPLAGVDAPGLTASVDALVERWLGAVEQDLGRRIEGDPATTIGLLTELTAAHPFREGLWALLMTALYRVGRQADALAAYRTARERLVEELGVEPGPRLRELESLILDHDQQLTAARPATAPPSGTVTFGFSAVEDAGGLSATNRDAMTRHADLVEVAAAEHGGSVFAATGDAVGVAFAHAGDAVAWAKDIQTATSGAGFRVRIAVHTAAAEQRGAGYVGPGVSVAARLATAGHGGQTLLSGATVAVLEGSEALRDLGTHRVPDVAGEQHLFQLGDEDHPRLRADQARRGNLPRELDGLIGREEDLGTVERAVAAHPVVTLVGPGGIGKTRLGIAAARRFEAEAWFIELAAISAPGDVPRAVADTLAVSESPGRTLTGSIVTALRSRRALLMLDNCEHLIDAAAALAKALAEGCSEVHVLATSRERLAISGERLIEVAPLDAAGPGVALFAERAAAASATFDAHASRHEIEEICRRLDGIPLAIELTAARMRGLSPAELLQRLGSRLTLSGGRRTGAERHRTLRATIQWSYDLLTAAERALFTRLSVFAGPFDIAAAEAVAGQPGHEVDVLLADLVDRSMVVPELGRFRLLETMRAYAFEQLEQMGEAEAIAERHSRWCRDQAGRIGRLLAGPAEIEGVARLDELWPDLRAAFDRACKSGDRELARAFVRPVVAEVLLRSRQEIGDWLERLLAVTPPEDEETRVFALAWAAQRYAIGHDLDAYERLADRYDVPDHPLILHARAFAREDYEALLEWAPQAVAELRARGDDDLAEHAEIDVGAALLNLGRFDEHDTLVAAVANRHRAHGPPTLLNWSLMLLGYSATFQGDHKRAEQLFEEAVAIDVPARTHSPNKPIEARVAFRHGDRKRAFRILRFHIDELLATDNMQGASIAAVEFINMMAALDRVSDTARMLGYLETTGLLDAPPFRALVEGPARKVAASTARVSNREHNDGRDLDDRQALEDMRRALEWLNTE
jgi:predicted ATPase/DNA-binding SARP family transcriptional activator